MSTVKLYDRDFYAWSMQAAELLRQRRFAELDTESLIEEVEDLGKSVKRELKSRLRTLLEHLLYISYLARDEREGWGWKSTAIEQRQALADLLADNPSLKTCLETATAEAYLVGRKLCAAKAHSLEPTRKLREEELPETCPWTIGELLTADLYLSREELDRRSSQNRARR